MIGVLGIAPYKILPARTGGERYITGFYAALAAWCRLEVVSVKKNEAPALPYVLHRLFSDSPARYINPLQVFQLARLIRRAQLQVILVEHPYMGWMAVLLRLFTGKPFVIHSHNIEANRFKTLGKWWWPLLRAYEGWIHRRANGSFFITSEDADYAIQHYRVKAARTSVVTFGMETPAPVDKNHYRALLLQRYALDAHTVIYQFNGSLGYLPNEQAVRHILEDILPLLRAKATFPFVILVCGGHLQETLVQAIAQTNGQVIYTGFVDQLEDYLRGSDIFMNPVLAGGGIKTKLVEAIAYGLTAVSCESGAIGVPASIAAPKLKLAADLDWHTFVARLLEVTDAQAPVPQSFRDYFNWENITRHAAEKMEMLAKQ
ncbi:Glycosyltransferase Family 4 [Chitinophaga costaii]|uniref:Glycosyltransferase Family 4 n=1 Tax=Chitinophaga costaii TaxID=1335309 RepID=A0A1C4ECR3_9BACT|nr:glycosyltransferase family 4 protein [Chitinophaga costaii]PUZ23905.1 glycosyl transferase group 1 [Chitinophaga costaii]SCC41388.1 Glycosyltransferase Family 4 [Chitinophaga costaii]